MPGFFIVGVEGAETVSVVLSFKCPGLNVCCYSPFVFGRNPPTERQFSLLGLHVNDKSSAHGNFLE